MNTVARERFFSRLERLNAPGYTYLKILFRQLAVYLISFAAGILGYYFLKIPACDRINSYISAHFSYVFEGRDGFFDCFRALVEYSALDIKHIALVFAAGFTVFSFAACTLACAYRGLSFGFSVGYVVLAVANREITVAHFELAFLVFLAANVLIAALFISFSARSVIFSYDLRRSLGKRRTVFNFVLAFLVCFGSVVIIDLVRCLFGVIYTF